MNVWRLTAANRLSKQDEKVPESTGKMKVRITKVLVNAEDGAIYGGDVKIKYPLTPGKFAVGIIAEDTPSPLFLKGARVLLHAFLPAPYTGTEKKDFSEDDVLVCGLSRDGYLCDFVHRGAEEMTPLPDNVTDTEALLAHYVAYAKAAVDKIDPEAGGHVAVIGGNLLGNLICQLLIDRQAVPVLIDDNPERLETAKRCGVYYTLFADDDVLGNLAQLTGGRLSDGALVASNLKYAVNPFALCAKNTRVVYAQMFGADVTVNLRLAMKKQLTVCGVSDVTGYVQPALSLLAGKAVNLSCAETATTPVENAEAAFASLSSGGDFKMTVLDLI